MSARQAKVRWSRRVEPQKIRRLYESEAQGMLDEALLNNVGYGIYVCCRESIELEAAARGYVKCRGCGQTIIRRLVDGRFDDSEILKCRMRKRELFEAIECTDSQFVVPWLDLVYGA